MLSKSQKETINTILTQHDFEDTQVIAIMQAVQSEYRYLSEDALSYIAKALKISEAKIYGVATFYENFSLEPKGRYIIRICDGTACHVRKSVPILQEFRKELGVTEECPTTKDMIFTVETVSCLGACGLAPVCTINGKVHPSMTPEKARMIINELRKESEDEQN